MQECLTQCSIRLDVAAPHERPEAARRFVEDQSYNEKGGEQMREAYHDLFGEKIGPCVPIVGLDSSPTFSDIDSNGDGDITSDEAIAYGNKMCVPDEMTQQIFTAADVSPQDGRVTQIEFNASGEDTLVEKAIDKGADLPSEGDNEYNEVVLPDFESWDRDKDGFLTEPEAFNAFMWELKRRNVAHHDTVTSGTGIRFEQEEMWHGLFDTLFPDMDVNGDRKISRREFYGPAIGADFGDELLESALADEDAPDPDGERHKSVTAPPYELTSPHAIKPVVATMLRSSQRSTSDEVHLSAARDRASLQELKGAMRGLARQDDSVAFSKSAMARVVDKAIHLQKGAAMHKNQYRFTHSKAI